MQSKLNNIIEYYNTCECDYRTFWDLDHSMAMHAGYWDQQTKSLADALARENEILAEYAKIQGHEKVLDAGCGIGGSSLFLAKHYGCQVTGITLSAQQVEKATAYAIKHGVGSLVDFQTMDYCRTTFPDASFDIVWGLESICHAEDKSLFIREAYRLLKTGGRLIMADGFGTQNVYTSKESEEMRHWLNGWGVDSLEKQEVFQQSLIASGFQNISYLNITKNVMPSSRRLYRISLPAIVLSKIGEWVGFRTEMQTRNIWAAYYQYSTLKKGVWEYGIFCAHKY